MGLYVTYIRIRRFRSNPYFLLAGLCDLGRQLAQAVLLGADFGCGLSFCTSTYAILPQSALVKMLILAAAWTQANYVFEQLTKLHDVLDVQPRVRDADTKPQFTKEQIVKMWKQVRKSDAYWRLYEDPPTWFAKQGRNVSEVGEQMLRNPMRDYPRIPCTMDFLRWTSRHDLRKPELLLYIGKLEKHSSPDPELLLLNPQSIIEFNYEDDGSGDLHALHPQTTELPPGTYGRFDFVLISQVLEHLWDPVLALRNLLGALRPGGYLFASAPALNIQHLTPMHFFHYTPMGLAMAVTRAGFEIVHTGQWGNIDYEVKLFSRTKWLGYKMLEKPVKNDPQHPVGVWTLVRKPLGLTA